MSVVEEGVVCCATGVGCVGKALGARVVELCCSSLLGQVEARKSIVKNNVGLRLF